EGKDLADEVLAGEAEHRVPLLGSAAPEVLELGPFALERGEVVVLLALEVVTLLDRGRGLGLEGLELLAREVALGDESLDLGQELLRRDRGCGHANVGRGHAAGSIHHLDAVLALRRRGGPRARS